MMRHSMVHPVLKKFAVLILSILGYVGTSRCEAVGRTAPPAPRTAETAPAPAPAPVPWIGYTLLRTDLPGGRHANVSTSRARMVRADGSGDRELGSELLGASDAWTQFAGWSPDGRLAVIHRGWEDPENARWEEEHPSPEGTALVYSSKQDGVRQLVVMRLRDRRETPLTALKPGYAAMWPHWQPR
jgi:hypothetical protein